MDKNELIELISNGKTDTLLIKLEADGIEVWERDFHFVLEDIVKKYFR